MALNGKEERKNQQALVYLSILEREEQFKPKASRKIKEIIKMREEINEIKNRKTIEKINKT